MLVYSLLLMGAATVLMGLLPGYVGGTGKFEGVSGGGTYVRRPDGYHLWRQVPRHASAALVRRVGGPEHS